jgi:hypothetical protein
LLHAALEELVELLEKFVEGDVSQGDIEGGEAELAFEGAAAGGFDINDAVLDVGVGVEGIG